MATEAIRNKIGTIEIDPGCDNLGIMIASYFEDHPDRPENDPVNDDRGGWGEWVLEKADEALDKIAEALNITA